MKSISLLKSMKSGDVFVTIVVVILSSTSFRARSQQVDVFRMGSSGEFLRPKDVSSSKLQEIYFDSTWNQTEVTLDNNDKSQRVLARYELRSNQLEIKTQNVVSVLNVGVIKWYTSFDKFGNPHEFVNGKDFTLDGRSLNCMLEVLSTGRMSLYKKYSLYIKKPDYNATLSVGNPNEQLFMETNFYYTIDKTLVKVPTKRKKFLQVFDLKAPQVERFIQQNNLSFSKESGLIAVFNYFNNQ